MPEWFAERRRQLSIPQITTLQAQAWRDLMQDGKEWVKIDRIYGGPAVGNAYRTLLAKGADPAFGMIWSLWDGPGLAREAQSKL